MTAVRDLAINCTAKLYAFRKTREGVIVQFVLDPTEVPAKLQTDHIGTSYVMALCEIDDATGQPKEGGGAAESTRHSTRTDASPRSPERQDKPATAGGAKSYAKECGRMCSDIRFQKFVRQYVEDAGVTLRAFDGAPEEWTASYVRWLCNVASRKEITAGTTAERKWNALVAEYELERVA